MNYNKKKLFAFGCSFTYGVDLEDCSVPGTGGPIPSKFAWPSILADRLGYECVNYSNPGFSIKDVALRVLEQQHEIKTDDLVFILWPYFHRTSIIKAQGRIGIGYRYAKPNKLISLYYKHFFDNNDNCINGFLLLDLITTKFNLKGIGHFNMLVDKPEIIPPWSTTYILPVEPFQNFYKRSPEIKLNLHPGKDTHIEFVESILKVATFD